MTDTLREDEIEAILKFDNASLMVTRYDDLTSAAGQEYVANITRPAGDADEYLARGAPTRAEAVQEVWKVYQQRQGVGSPVENPEWPLEDALGRVEVIRAAIYTNK